MLEKFKQPLQICFVVCSGIDKHLSGASVDW
jgi:hypothetical protein